MNLLLHAAFSNGHSDPGVGQNMKEALAFGQLPESGLVLSEAAVEDGSNLRESRFSRILEKYFEISLLDLDLEAFSFHFSFSISISRHFHFTFHSRNE